MDFASLMEGAIGDASSPSKSKKYMKRADIEAERQATYLAEQRKIEEEKAAKLIQKRKREEEELEASKAREIKRAKLAEESRRRREEQDAEEERARRKKLGLPELIKEVEEEVEENDIKDEELVEKLREIGEPIKLFGESHRQRLRRFRKLGVVMTKSVIPTSLVLVDEKDMKVDEIPKDAEGKQFLFRQLASYFTMVLTEWEAALQKESRETFASKAAYNAMVRAKEDMTPVSQLCICGERKTNTS
jgi:pre-mRNA-splicing factor 18